MVLNYFCYATCQLMIIFLLPRMLVFHEIVNDLVVYFLYIFLVLSFYFQHFKIESEFETDQI